MGYVPPPFPLQEYIDVTCLDDDAPRHITWLPRASHADLYAERLQWARHAAYMDTAHAETMRGARIGCILLAALVLDVVAIIAQAAGLL